MNKLLMTLVFLSLLLIPLAVSAAPSVSIVSPDDGETLESLSSIRIHFDPGNATGYSYTVYALIGARFPNGDDISIAGDVAYQEGITSASTLTFPVRDEWLIPDTILPISVHVLQVNETTGNMSEVLDTNITISYGNPVFQATHLFFRDHYPIHQAKDGTSILYGQQGAIPQIECAAVLIHGSDAYVLPRTLFIAGSKTHTQGRSRIEMFGRREIGYPLTETIVFNDAHIIHYGDGHQRVTVIGSFPDYNESYHFHYGFQHPTAVDTPVWFAPMGWESIPTETLIHADRTAVQLSWSMDTDPKGAVPTGTFVANDHRYDHILYGVAVSYPASPYPLMGIGGGQDFSMGMVGVILTEYGESIGIPWFPLLFVLLILGLCMAFPLSFAIKYEFSLPNHVYAASTGTGVFFCYLLGLVSFWWMAVLFIALVLSVVYIFRDYLGTVIGLDVRDKAYLGYLRERMRKKERPPKKDIIEETLPIRDFPRADERVVRMMRKPERQYYTDRYWKKTMKDYVPHRVKGTGRTYWIPQKPKREVK